MLNLTGVIHDWSQIGIIILSCALFVWAVNNPKTVYVPVLEEIGVKYSLDIYVFHILVNMSLSMVFKHIGLMDNIVMAWSYPIIVAFSSLLLAMIIYRFKILNCSVGKRKREEIDA